MTTPPTYLPRSYLGMISNTLGRLPSREQLIVLSLINIASDTTPTNRKGGQWAVQEGHATLAQHHGTPDSGRWRLTDSGEAYLKRIFS